MLVLSQEGESHPISAMASSHKSVTIGELKVAENMREQVSDYCRHVLEMIFLKEGT